MEKNITESLDENTSALFCAHCNETRDKEDMREADIVFFIEECFLTFSHMFYNSGK